MKLMISVVTAISLGLTWTAFASKYSDLAAKGYRWVTADGPYASPNQQDAERMVHQRPDVADTQPAANNPYYYLIPGTIVRVLRQDPATGMSEIWLGGVTKPLWTYSRFLSKAPVRDADGITQTPENSGLMPGGDGIVPDELSIK
jgi:hypothetical protein